MMTTPVTQEDTQEDHVGDGDSSVHDYDNVPPLAVGCQLMSRTLCSMQSLNLQYTQHINTYSPLHAQRQVRCSPFESQYKNPVFWSSDPPRAPFDHIWAMVWSGARGNIAI